MKKNEQAFLPASELPKNGYIPAPYVLEEGEKISDFVLKPVIFHNENGPDIGVTTCGVIVQDGLFFKDLNNDGQLEPCKDWRLSLEERTQDFVARMTVEQQAGFMLNALQNNPMSRTRKEAVDENGELVFSKIYRVFDPNEPPVKSPLAGMNFTFTEQDVMVRKVAAGVYRGEMNIEAGMAALYNNVGSQMLEYEACQGGVAVPYTTITNPINIGYPDSLGIGAAVLGDGNFDLIHDMAEADRKMMKAAGINVMYGPQVDVSTDPRWPRINGTYGERTDITTGIITELIDGYQVGKNGLNADSVVLMAKHFPGDGPSENGFEAHQPIGQWRLYPTEGSFEKYHIAPFQAACDAGIGSMMPDYARATNDGRSVPQYYKGEKVNDDPLPSCYNSGLLNKLLRGEMGFKGYINSDSGVTSVQCYGMEENTVPERYAAIIKAGTNVIGGNTDVENIIAAIDQGLMTKEDLAKSTYQHALTLFQIQRVDNPYLCPDKADQVREENFEGAKLAAQAANRKAVVLVKNHEQALPLAKEQKVFVKAFRGDPSAGMYMAGIGAKAADPRKATEDALKALFAERGYTVVETPDEADVAYLHVWPLLNTMVFNQFQMPVIELVEGLQHEMREKNAAGQKKTGEYTTVSTVMGISEIKMIADQMHAKGGKVIGTIIVTNPWILTPLEPYCDALTVQYTTSPVAVMNAYNAQLDVISGDYNPTGKLSLTMVSSPEVIAITEKEIDGKVYEICASPNDVPGYDKDPYIDPSILAKVPGGSYAYCDADGNYYRSGFGLKY